MSIKVKKIVKKMLTLGEKSGIILKLSVRKNQNILNLTLSIQSVIPLFVLFFRL